LPPLFIYRAIVKPDVVTLFYGMNDANRGIYVPWMKRIAEKLGSSKKSVGKTDQFAGGCAPPNPAPLAAAGVRGELWKGLPAASERKRSWRSPMGLL
jgi:hypothetical protein